jgi:hypothetical protein
MAVAKVMQKDSEKNMSIKKLWKWFVISFLLRIQGSDTGRNFIALTRQAIN